MRLYKQIGPMVHFKDMKAQKDPSIEIYFPIHKLAFIKLFIKLSPESAV